MFTNKTWIAISAIAMAVAMYLGMQLDVTRDAHALTMQELQHAQASYDLELDKLRGQLVVSESKRAGLEENLGAMLRKTQKAQANAQTCVAALESAQDALVQAQHDFAKIQKLASELDNEDTTKDRLLAAIGRK